MEAPQTLYNQSATHFALPLYLRKETMVEGRLIADLAETFLSTLLFPGMHPTALWTKRASQGAKLNTGDFTSARWKAAQTKILKDEYAVVHIEAHTPDFPNQKIWFNAHVNPVGGQECSDTWKVMCSISYLRHLAASPANVDALLHIAKTAWNKTPGGPAYGYGHIAITLARPPFDPWKPQQTGSGLPWEDVKPPETRAHAVPIAYMGNDIELNLAGSYTRGRGIKGAFWANFLSAAYVAMAGGEASLRTKLSGMRVESLQHGGLLIVATDSPLPEDTDATQERFWRLTAALQPAFLSREQTAATMRDRLGYFYRERPSVR